MNLNKLFEEILNGNAMLFCGSGFSYGAKNLNGAEVGSTKELISFLQKELNSEEEEIDFLSEYYIENFGEEKLIQFLKNQYKVKKVGNEHEYIANLSWKRIYTTNYDNILEMATNYKKETLVLSQEPYKYKDLSSYIIHLNGSIHKLEKSILESEFKLTQSSYLSDTFSNSKWASIFKMDLTNVKAVVFIGYSLKYDLDLKKILFQDNEEFKDKIFFVNGEIKSEKDKFLIKKFGQNTQLTLQEFVLKLEQFSKTYERPHYYRKPLYSLEEIKYGIKNEAKEKNIIDLLLYGDCKREYIFDGNYIFSRKVIDEIVNNISKERNNKLKFHIIHSEFGNGKTIVLEKLKFKLCDSYKVFELKKIDKEFYSDIETIIKEEGIKIIIIDNIGNNLDFFNIFERFNLDEIIFILSIRTNIIEILLTELEKAKIELEEFKLYDINKLEKEEINNIISYFDKNNIWGIETKRNKEEKYTLLNKTCERQINYFLLKILQESSVGKKLDDLAKNILNDKNLEKVFLMILLDNSLALNLKANEVVRVLQIENLLYQLKLNKNFAELINLEKNKIKMQSSIITEYILKQEKFSLKNKMIDLMIAVMKKIDNLNNREYNNVKYQLISFTNFQIVIKNAETKDYIRYYEEIKNLDYCKLNPYFLIQYANVKMSNDEYDVANIYLNNAESLGEIKDLYQLDSCKARYFLEEAIFNKRKEDILGTFQKAHNLLFKNRNMITKWNFPLKQTKLYEKYWYQFKDDMSGNDKAMFLYSCIEIEKKIKEYKEHCGKIEKKYPRDVMDAEKSIKKLIGIIGS